MPVPTSINSKLVHATAFHSTYCKHIVNSIEHRKEQEWETVFT